MLWIFSSHLCIFTRAHIAWVYSYGLSLATSFTFAMTLVGLRVREWKKVIKEATKERKAFEFETMKTYGKRREEMVVEVAWLEKRLNLRSGEQKWGLDQVLVTRGLLATNLCLLPPNSPLWDQLDLSPPSPYNSSSPLITSPSKSSSYLGCYQGDERTCDRSTLRTKLGCLWWHFHPDQGAAEMKKKYYQILQKLNQNYLQPRVITEKSS